MVRNYTMTNETAGILLLAWGCIKKHALQGLQKNLLVKSRFNHGKQTWVKTEVVWFHSNSNLKIYGNPPEGMLTGVTGLLDIA